MLMSVFKFIPIHTCIPFSSVVDCAADIRLRFKIDGAVCILFHWKAVIVAQFVAT